MINKIFRCYYKVQRQKLECHPCIWRQIFEALENSNLSRFPPLKAKWIFYFREIPRRYFITFLFHSCFTGNEWRNILFHFYFIDPDQMTKYFTTFLFHSYFTGNEWRNILSHFYFILSSPGTNDEIFYHIFISFLFHPEHDEIFYFLFISSIRIEWRNILSHFYFILSSPGTNDEIFYFIIIS